MDDPVVGPDSLLVEVAAAGINPVDWKIVAGYLQGAFPPHLPMIPGWDVAGTVRAVGPAVVGVAPGDRVAAYARKDHVQNGTYAELVAVPERAYAKVPEGVDLTTAGALPLAGLTAEQLLDATEVGEGDTVLVHAAAGGVGSFAVQLAALRGARVIGTASEGNHDYLRGLGAEPVTYGDALVQNVRALAPEGVDVVIDLIGGDALEATPMLMADGGRVASIIDADAVQGARRPVRLRPSRRADAGPAAATGRRRAAEGRDRPYLPAGADRRRARGQPGRPRPRQGRRHRSLTSAQRSADAPAAPAAGASLRRRPRRGTGRRVAPAGVVIVGLSAASSTARPTARRSSAFFGGNAGGSAARPGASYSVPRSRRRSGTRRDAPKAWSVPIVCPGPLRGGV